LGPPAGRYVVRRYAGDDVRQVIVVSEPEAGEPRRRRRRRVVAGPPATVAPVTRVTVIFASALEDPAAWLREARAEPAASVLARLVGLYRIAAADPLLADPDPARALVVRAGYGRGEVVAEGTWEAARELAADASPGLRLRRGPDLRPHERLAALLSARDAALACEELALRARADLDHGREREAAIQLEAALVTALAELRGWTGVAGVPRRLSELEGYAAAVAAAALAAREGRLEAAHVETVSAALARLEAALRVRVAGT
jgi:hypothetical protein